MEWWENEGFDQVNELSTKLVDKTFQKRLDQISSGNYNSKKTMNAQMRTVQGYNKRLGHGRDVGYELHDAAVYGQGRRDGVADFKDKISGRTAMAMTGAAVGYTAYKGGKALYNKFKNRNKGEEGDAKAANEGWSWYDDPGAMSIMESYFDEFADADMQ
jgi:hypothetical protein